MGLIRAFEARVGHVAGRAAAFQNGRTVVQSTSPKFHRQRNSSGNTHGAPEAQWRCPWNLVGDTLRRLVAHTIAQQLSVAVEAATAPFQYALSTRAGTECVAHALQSLTEENPTTTVMSIDGIGAFDLVSRKAMLQALMSIESGSAAILFVRMFYRQASTYLWEDNEGHVHRIEQGEGGEQGDPMMPLLFALGQQTALSAIQGSLDDEERLLAFHDDLYVVTPDPDRLQVLYGTAIPAFALTKGRPKCGTLAVSGLDFATHLSGSHE